MVKAPQVGRFYNWIGQPERLIFLGVKYYPDGRWYQFALVEKPEELWCEVRYHDLENFEETDIVASKDGIIYIDIETVTGSPAGFGVCISNLDRTILVTASTTDMRKQALDEIFFDDLAPERNWYEPQGKRKAQWKEEIQGRPRQKVLRK
jgi:hypothetical protein